MLLGRQPEVTHLVGARAHLHRTPAQVEGELERAAGVDPVVVEVGEADLRRHRREMGVAQRRRHPLGERDVGAPARAHLAARPGLGAAPGLRVVAVEGFVDEGRPLAFRVEAPAAVLDSDRVAAAREEDRVGHLRFVVLVVGGADQDDRAAPGAVRQVDVGGEAHPVAHRDRYPEHRTHPVAGMGYPGGGVAVLCHFASPRGLGSRCNRLGATRPSGRCDEPSLCLHTRSRRQAPASLVRTQARRDRLRACIRHHQWQPTTNHGPAAATSPSSAPAFPGCTCSTTCASSVSARR